MLHYIHNFEVYSCVFYLYYSWATHDSVYLHQALTVVNVGATEASLRQSECSDTGSSTAGGKQGDSSTSVDPDDLSDPIQTHAECCWLAGGVLSSVLSHMCETDQDQAGCWLLCKNIFKKRLSCSLTHCMCFLQTEEQAWKCVFHSKQNDNLNRDSALLIVFVSKSLWHTAEQQKYTLFLWELHLSYLHHFVFLWRLQGNKWKWE